ncbi:MAG: dienelactone hydrolase family protein [Mariniblastus sp.]
MKISQCCFVLFVLLFCSDSIAQQRNTLPALENNVAPANFEEMWAGFDPQAEPLEIEMVKQWEEDGVVLRVVRFRIGVFKNKKSTLAAIYGFPKNAIGKKLPGLLQIHGGGQYADQKSVVANARRGYATVSIAWAGRIAATDYLVNPPIVKLFWDSKTDDPNYKLTTDWGAVDAYHAPSRNPRNNFPSVNPADWTIDSVPSPRNSPWYLCALAARRALTFLEQQPEVDATRIGVYGHSMGGKLTVMTSTDKRVKAAAPSCGGISDRYNKSDLFNATIGDDVSLKQITCPIIFLSPANDFHGRIGDLPAAIEEINTEQWRVTCSPHHNHQDTEKYEAATLLWFDHHLKQEFVFPATPQSILKLNTQNGIPFLTVQPDKNSRCAYVDIFYTQQGLPNETSAERERVVNRFWHHAPAINSGGSWSAELPIADVDKPLWAYANVTYELEKPVEGAGYYYRAYTANRVNLSALIEMVPPSSLKAANCKATLKPTNLIEDFAEGWQKEWFTYKPQQWARSTHKLYDETWRSEPDSKLVFQVRSKEANQLVVKLDNHAAVVDVEPGEAWQQVRLSLGDFKNFKSESLTSWDGIKELKLSHAEWLKPERGDPSKPRLIGKNWIGADPKFRDLRWD